MELRRKEKRYGIWQDGEQAVRRWFSMWLEGRDTGILQLFAPDALYIESWGPEYRGASRSSTGLRSGIPAERYWPGTSGAFFTERTGQW